MMSYVSIMDDQTTNVENLSPSCYIAICILCSVTFDWLWLPRTFILLAMTFQSTRQESPWATKASQAGSTKMSLGVLGWQNVLKCLRGFYWMRLWAQIFRELAGEKVGRNQSYVALIQTNSAWLTNRKIKESYAWIRKNSATNSDR